MAHFMKYGTTGEMMEAEESSDPELEAVYMTAEEYREYESQLQTYKEKSYKAQKEKCLAKNEAKQARKEKLQMQKELIEESSFNLELIRIGIMRVQERRGVQDPENNSGYIVILSLPYREKYVKENDLDSWKHDNPDAPLENYKQYEDCVGDCWKTILQTPYDAKIPLERIKENIEGDLFDLVMEELGVPYCVEVDSTEYAHISMQEICDEREKDGYLYRWKFHANQNAGLWEVIIYHSKKLNVPKEYKLPNHGRRTEKKKHSQE